eukprot:3349398-Pyramimonas_sp.AAC.1
MMLMLLMRLMIMLVILMLRWKLMMIVTQPLSGARLSDGQRTNCRLSLRDRPRTSPEEGLDARWVVPLQCAQRNIRAKHEIVHQYCREH